VERSVHTLRELYLIVVAEVLVMKNQDAKLSHRCA
jgi:hypothetical protein